ncbi:hypothetical protein BY996DRAFT_4586444 [Phakopsora pachyrhizi]|nr:hypothetical protein BY996DRAFT_4586444 [Phakopsora pachyrhizi]
MRKYEEDHVHQVYESIASHFSQTRYKPWPIVASFLSDQPLGSIGIDLGCGNGKYLHSNNLTSVGILSQSEDGPNEKQKIQLPIGARPPLELIENQPNYLLIGLDRSGSLLNHSRNSKSDPELILSDCLSLPLRSSFWFDFAISIATIHHLSTELRRKRALVRLLSLILPSKLRSNGSTENRRLVFVWALEQGSHSKRSFEKRNLLPASKPTRNKSDSSWSVNKEDSDYHTLKENNLNVTEEVDQRDVFVPWTFNSDSLAEGQNKKTFNRFYHLFREGELVELIDSAAKILRLKKMNNLKVGNNSEEKEGEDCWNGWYRIVRDGWEADNWWAEFEVGS